MEQEGMYDTGISARETGLPCLRGINRWRARMALNNVCLYCSFQIELAPIFGAFYSIASKSAGLETISLAGFGSFPQNAGQNNDWLTRDSVMESGDYGVVARETLAGNLPLKHPDSLGELLRSTTAHPCERLYSNFCWSRERKRVEAAAKASNKTVSAWVRSTLAAAIGV